jgi:hypothetical protein
MTDRWADYLISAVRFNAADTHIDRVRLHRDNGDTVGEPQDASRATVVQALERGTTFITMFWNAIDNNWKKGAEVRTVTVDGVKYIRTDADRTKKDNLDRLPRY